jgi:DNA (cytosine-5)-methyltransferase 1
MAIAGIKAKKMSVGVLDFFSGCGGVSWGFQHAKVRGTTSTVISGVDIDESCCLTYEKMIGAPSERLDIRHLVGDPKLLRRYKRKWKLGSFDQLVMVGCAPCQGFAAHRKAVDGADHRRPLFVEFCRLAAEIGPDAILMENVPDLFSKQHWPYFQEGRRLLEGAGYIVRARIYNLAGFGLPQERFRAVMLAFRRPFDMPQPFLAPEAYRTVREAIGKLPHVASGDLEADDPMHICSKHRKSTIDILAQVPKDGGNRPVGVGPKCLDRARDAHGGYTDVYGRLAWDRPAVTITARCRTPSCGRFAHPEENRGLTIREAALLQGFPADYMFEGPFDDRYKQIGNAVPPLVARRLAEHVLEMLRGAKAVVSPSDPRDITAPVGPGFAVTINGIKRRRAAVGA